MRPLLCRSCVVIAFVLISFQRIGAVPISIINYSFEDITVPDGYYTVNNVSGWLGEASWYHIVNPTDAQFYNTTDGGSGPSPLDGHNAAAVNNYGHLLYQNLTATVQPNYTYTLTALVGHRLGVPFDNGSVNLIAGDNFLARGFISPSEGSFTRLTVVFNSSSSGIEIGQNLRIELRSAGDIAQAWFDDIHLDATASASGVTATTITPYVPLPSVNPDYIARKDLNWGEFTPFGGGPLDGTPSVTSVPEGGSNIEWVLSSAIAWIGLVLLRRRVTA